ncbi:MAG: hypothetical protein RXR08_09755 [Sulfolobaceae archaeon]
MIRSHISIAVDRVNSEQKERHVHHSSNVFLWYSRWWGWSLLHVHHSSNVVKVVLLVHKGLDARR